MFLNQGFVEQDWTIVNPDEVTFDNGTVRLTRNVVAGEIKRTFALTSSGRFVFAIRNMTFHAGNRVRLIFRDLADTTTLHGVYNYNTGIFNSHPFGALAFVDAIDAGFMVRIYIDNPAYDITLSSFDVYQDSDFGGAGQSVPRWITPQDAIL